MSLEQPEIAGLICLRSSYTAAETFARLGAALEAHGVRIFCRVDHSGVGGSRGVDDAPDTPADFREPARRRTPLMNEAPTLAVDLPLKALVYEDASGTVWLAWNDPAYLAQRHGVTSPVTPLRAVEAFFREAAGNPTI